MRQNTRLGVDIGGTFTDLCVLVDGQVAGIGKTLTTAEPAEGVERVIRETLATLELDARTVTQVVHATTLVTNALIERRGAKTALLMTAGFRDVVEMARERRSDIYDVMVDLPAPLVPRHLRFDVPERTLADGSDRAGARRGLRRPARGRARRAAASTRSRSASSTRSPTPTTSALPPT